MNVINFAGKSFTVSKVICVGRNYVDHIKELNNDVPREPIIFLKPNSAVTDCIHSFKEYVEYEAEISFLIVEKKLSALALGIDFTKRKIQKECITNGHPWEVAKAFTHSAVFSPFVEVPKNLSNLSFNFYKNNKIVQSARLSDALFSPKTILDHCSNFLSFSDGDILMTGTPGGIGPVNPGDFFSTKLMIGEQIVLEHTFQNKA